MIKTVLVTDGSSDQVLQYPIGWLFREHGLSAAFQWANLLHYPRPPKSLKDKLEAALALYPCDLLLVHRDAEAQPWENRKKEILEAAESLPAGKVSVVPVRMTESWFLFNEPALRRAAGNPNGRASLDLPALARVESLSNPKQRLHDALRAASELRGRKLADFDVRQAFHRLAELCETFEPLRQLIAFRQLESEIRELSSQYRPSA